MYDTHVSMTVKFGSFSAGNRYLVCSLVNYLEYYRLHVIMPYWQSDCYFTELSLCVATASESVLFVKKKRYHFYDCSLVTISVFVYGR